MFKPDPIDTRFVPYTKRPRGKYNAALFVEGGKGRAPRSARVEQQNLRCLGDYCYDGKKIIGRCRDGECYA